MDIFVMLDEFEKEIESGKKFPLTEKVLLNQELLLDYIDRLRSELPEEMRQARWVLRERERVINEAEEEANKILDNTKAKIQQLASESEVTKEAQVKAEQIMQDAHRVAYEIKLGANHYADDLLVALEDKLKNTLEVIDNSRKEIQELTSKSEALEELP
jgi:vacuolar-type H+-ATPase subunit H